MRLVITIEHRFDRTPDGAVWTQVAFGPTFWKRYLEVFEQVRVVARINDIAEAPQGRQRADSEQVSFVALPHYLGPAQYLLKAREVARIVRGAVGRRDAVILRICSPIAANLEPLLHRTGHPYGVEVVGDPYDAFAPGAVKHPLRAFFRWTLTRQQKRQCARASAAAYVTAHYLQSRYPAGPAAFSTYYSSVDLGEEGFVSRPRSCDAAEPPFRLVTAGSLAQMYKSPDVLIDAVAECVAEGLDLRLSIVGDGKHRPELEARSAARGVADRVDFRGQIPAGEAVRARLDQADLFVLPSKTEGLPRALIEAMARALPCIGSSVGGIPELLPPEDMIPAGDVGALAAKIREVVTDPRRMAAMSARNLAKAAEYRDDVLRQRRLDFYVYLKDRTEAWLKTSAAR